MHAPPPDVPTMVRRRDPALRLDDAREYAKTLPTHERETIGGCYTHRCVRCGGCGCCSGCSLNADCGRCVCAVPSYTLFTMCTMYFPNVAVADPNHTRMWIDSDGVYTVVPVSSSTLACFAQQEVCCYCDRVL